MGARCGRGQLKLAGSCLLLAPDGSFVHTDDPDNHDPTCSTPPPSRTKARAHGDAAASAGATQGALHVPTGPT